MKNTIVLIYCFLLVSVTCVQGQRVYVNLSATGANTGQSWQDAYPDLQQAFQGAQAGDTLWIATGTYYPTQSTDRSISFEPISGLRIFGGFSGEETQLVQRDWLAHPTVLSGDIGVLGDTSDNSLNVLYLFQPDSNTVLDGLVIRNGLANDVPNAGSAHSRLICGGGLYVQAAGGAAYPEIRNCRFEHNIALYFGGAVMLENGNNGSVAPRFINCTFNANRAEQSGGGLARFGASQIERGIDMEACVFTNNYAAIRGGGFLYTDSEGKDSLDLHNCRFTNNFAGSAGGGAFLLLGRSGKSRLVIEKTDFSANNSKQGSTLRILGNGNVYDGELKIDSCIFSNNTTIEQVSGIITYIDLLTTPQSRLHILQSKFLGNAQAGYILSYSFEGSVMMENTIFINNATTVAVQTGEERENMIKNCVFSNNTFNLTGLFRYGSTSNIYFLNCLFNNNHGTGLSLLYFAHADTCKIENCTFYNNYVPKFSNMNFKYLFLYNTFMDSIAGDQYFYQENTITHLSSSYLKGFNCTVQHPNIFCDGNIITSGDPLFVDPANGVFRLQPCSPLVNAGSNTLLSAINTTDLSAMPRIQGGTVDIGPYETPAPQLASAPVVSPACPGAANGQISLEPVTGCAPYQVAWTSAGGSGQDLQHLPAGDYLFTVTDGRGSSFTFPVTVPTGSNLALQAQSSPVVCGDTLGGSAAVQVSQGQGPFTFQWPGSSDSLLTRLPAGSYLVTVTDANGCTATATVAVGKTGGLHLDIDVVNISCYGAADGSLTVVPLDGQAPFQWAWENGPATPTYAPLAPGSYQGSITDAFGCGLLYVLPVSQPDSLSFTAAITAAADSLAGNGSIQLGPVNGGTPPYNAIWSTGQTGLALHDLSPGSYSVALVDANGCIKTAAYLVGVTSATSAVPTEPLIALFPSPADQVIHIQRSENTGSGLMSICNVLGQPVWQQAGSDRPDPELAVGSWPAGVYYLSIAIKGERLWRGTFVVQH